jgi:hypothetical protein
LVTLYAFIREALGSNPGRHTVCPDRGFLIFSEPLCTLDSYGLEVGVQFPATALDFAQLYNVKTGSGTRSASYPMCTRGSLWEVKRPGRQVDHSPPSNAEVNSGGIYRYFPLSLHGVVLN